MQFQVLAISLRVLKGGEGVEWVGAMSLGGLIVVSEDTAFSVFRTE